MTVSVDAKPILLVWEGCDGKAQYAQLHVTWSNMPTIECAKQMGQHDPLWGAAMIVGFAVACGYSIGNEAYIVVPYGASPAMIAHEIGHATGSMDHPPLIPIAENWCTPRHDHRKD